MRSGYECAQIVWMSSVLLQISKCVGHAATSSMAQAPELC